MRIKLSVLDRCFLLILLLICDLLAFCPFLFVFAVLALVLALAIALFVVGGTFLSCLFGVDPDLFWGTNTQIFQLISYFFKWYNYLALGLLLLLIGLWGVFFCLFSMATYLKGLVAYLAARYQMVFR